MFGSDWPLLDYEKTNKKCISEFLWQGVYCHIGIKDSLPKKVTLCKYTWEVVICIVMTGERCSGPNIWPETPNQDTSTEDMIYTTYYKEAMKWREINPQQQYLSSLNAKKACYASYISSNLKNSYAHLVTDPWFYHGILGPYNRKSLGPDWDPLLVIKQWCYNIILFV